MSLSPSALAWLALSSWALAAIPGWEPEPVFPGPEFQVVLYGQASGGRQEGEGGTYQKTRLTGDLHSAEYGFRNFNGDSLQVRFQVAKATLAAYEAGFGYTQKDFDKLHAWHEKARQEAYQLAVKTKKPQAQLDAALAGLKKEYEEKLRSYLASRGFRILPQNTLAVDMPLLVRRNSGPLRTVAEALDKFATAKRYDSESLIGAATAMVQTALLYRIPPRTEGERQTGGLLLPVKALVLGWGDCDTKTGLLASILANWPHMRLVGIAIPGHYLMGVLRIPSKGDLFVEHEGLQYVLIEPAGPAWLAPGSVGQETLAKLEGSEGYQIEPFF